MEYVERPKWNLPEGEGSNIKERMDHTVVHVSWNGVMAFCKWTENEYERKRNGNIQREEK